MAADGFEQDSTNKREIGGESFNDKTCSLLLTSKNVVSKPSRLDQVAAHFGVSQYNSFPNAASGFGCFSSVFRSENKPNSSALIAAIPEGRIAHEDEFVSSRYDFSRVCSRFVLATDIVRQYALFGLQFGSDSMATLIFGCAEEEQDIFFLLL